MIAHRVILGSRSPRRFELLALVIPAELIEVLPPRSVEEAGFDGLTDWSAIEDRLRQIVAAKSRDVLDQLAGRIDWSLLLTADTIIVATDPGGGLRVLGQPPDDDWEATVREWFIRYYAGQTHWAATAFCLSSRTGQRIERLVRTSVRFHADAARWLDWYLQTGESRGKAGGYAIQGAGSVFVEKVEGSLTNVVGLPLRELLNASDEIGVPSLARRAGMVESP